MKSFLEHVASDILSKYGTNLSRVAVVFPNKRASLFLNEHLARQAGKPLWSPAYITISDLFRTHSEVEVADPIQLVCLLHQCYTECTGIDETLDHFYGWGQLLLSDFDDLDKNMASADKVFANLRDIHELDDVSYLTPEQREIIRRFFSNFSENHPTELKERFLRLWSRIGDIYHLFNSRLAEQRLSYEGALYRQVATDTTIEFRYDTYLFVGFNLLQQVEQTLFRRLRHEGKARFYWDFDDYYLQRNEAGHYVAQYLDAFPNELDNRNQEIYANFVRPKRITYISAPTEDIQARYINQWLEGRPDNQEQGVGQRQRRKDGGRRTAIVLCHEGLLQTVVHSLPDSIEKVNVTTGYPLQQTTVTSLVHQVIALHVTGYATQTDRYRLRYVNAVLRHPYARHISPLSQELHRQITNSHTYYPSPQMLAKDEGLTLLFDRNWNADGTSPEPPNARLLHRILALIRHIACHMQTPVSSSPLDTESLFRMYTLLNRVSALVDDGILVVDTITLQRLVTQLIQTTSIPFHGEPAEGIQIMGVLETRNLDFDHVLLLSCNEGNMPRGVNDTSFIPYSIRKAYGLTTVDHKVAIHAYYFHRLLQRASDITIVYNNSTNDGQTGEMSRFMLQLMVESPHPIRFERLKTGQHVLLHTRQPIPKTPEVMKILSERFSKEQGGISPTAINRYMRCPLQFFYHYVCNLKEPDENDEDQIDNRIFGNIFHQAAQAVYERIIAKTGSHITESDIEQELKEVVGIERAVDDAFKSELFQIQDPAHPLPPLDGLQLINREVIIKYVRLLLEVDRKLTPFSILGLEAEVKMDYTVSVLPTPLTTTIGGRIDRLDCITDKDTGQPRVRVIDYKTSAQRLKALVDIDAVFDTKNIKGHSDYYLQTFLYSHIVRLNDERAVSPALLFIQHAGSEEYDPTLCLGKTPVYDIATQSERLMELLNEKINEIFHPESDFQPTDEQDRCRFCPYAALCGR